LHLVGQLLTLIHDAQTHEHKIYYSVIQFTVLTPNSTPNF